MRDSLSDELILYAAANTNCHRRVFENIHLSILEKSGIIDHGTYNCTVLKIDTEIIVNHRGRQVFKGEVHFNGIAGSQRKRGKETLGRNHIIVQVHEIINGNHKPKPCHSDWNVSSETLNDLWETVNGGLFIVTKH